MKRFILFLLFAAALATVATAQTANTTAADTTQPQMGPKRPATQRAVRQLKAMEKQLQLSQDQVLQLQVILIHRNVVIDSLRNNSSGDRRSDNRARRSIMQDTDAKIDAMLTEPQRTLYQQWKEQQREKMRENRRNNQPD